MGNEDVSLLFGVSGGGSLSGESGSLIQKQLNEIMATINKEPMKIKVALDTASGGSKTWSGQMQKQLNAISKSKSFSVKVSNIKIGAGAVSDFKRQLNSVINTLNLDKGTSITLTAKGIGEIKSRMKQAGESTDEAARKVAAFKMQLESLGGQKSSIQRAINGLRNGSVGDKEKSKIADISQQYEQWALKIEEVRASKTAASEEYQAQLKAEGIEIQANIEKLQQELQEKQKDDAEAIKSANAKARAEQKSAEAAARARQKTADAKARAEEKDSIVIKKVEKKKKSEGDGEEEYTHEETEQILRYNAALNKVNTTLIQLKNAEKNWTLARHGKTSGKYDELRDQITKLETLKKELESTGVSVKEFKRRFGEASAEYKTASESIRAAGENTKAFTGHMGSLAGKFTSWLTVSQLIMRGYLTLKQMVQAVVEVDTAMTELKKVTNETDATYDKFLRHAIVRSKELGATVADTVNATADFARLGYTINEASELADAALVYKNVGDGITNISEASESLISTMKAFGSATKDAMFIVDKFNETGNNFAISSRGVGDALLRSASALAAAGNTLDQSIALVTAANSTVQDPEKVGVALKTITMYLRAAKTEAEQAGESTDGMAASVSKLREQLLKLTGGKVDIMKNDDTFKSTYQIMKELSEVWDKLSDITHANITELIGGKRNSNVIMSLLQNFDTAEQVLTSSANAAGSALSENEKYLDSIEGKISKFKATFQEVSVTLINSSFVKMVVEFGTALFVILDGVAKIVNAVGGLNTVLIATVGIVTAIKLGALIELFNTKVAGWFNKGAVAVANFAGILAKLPGVLKELSSGAITVGEAISALGISASVAQLAIGGLTIVLTAALIAYNLHKQAVEQARQEAMSAADSAADLGKEISDLTQQYISLNDAVNAGKDAKDSLIKTEDALIDKLDLEKEHLEELIAKYGSYSSAVKAASVESLHSIEQKLRAGVNAQEENLLDKGKVHGLFSAKSLSHIVAGWDKDSADVNTEALKELVKAGYVQEGSFTDRTMNLYLPSTPEYDLSTVEGMINAYERLGKMLDVVSKSAGSENEVYKALSAEYGRVSDSLDKYNESVKALNINVAEQYVIQESIDKKPPQSQKEFEEYRKDVIDKAVSHGDFLGNQADITAAIDSVLAQNAQMSEYMSALKQQENMSMELSQKRQAIAEALLKGDAGKPSSTAPLPFDSLNDLLSKVGEYKNVLDELSGNKSELSDLLDQYKSEVAEANELGVDLSQTVFGNIDTNARQVLEWTDENIDKFEDALHSWYQRSLDAFGKDAVGSFDDYIDNLRGSFSTLLGSSEEFDGVEIAFSPMLQTPNGAVLLDTDTVRKYISDLIDEAGEGWTNEELLQLDTKGIEYDGQVIKGLIADIGDTAIKTGEAMHYVGNLGGIQTAYNELKDAALKAGLTVDDLNKAIETGVLNNPQNIEETINAAYNAVKQGATSWEDIKAALAAYNDEQAVAERHSAKLKDSISSLWSSSDFKSSKKDLLKMAQTISGITPDAIDKLAESSTGLASILNEDGMNAQFLAKVLQSMADGGAGLELITSDALKLNDALDGMTDKFDQVTEAKAHYDSAMSAEEKDTGFKSYAEAFKKLNEQFKAGTTNSNEFWGAAEYLFGSDQLAAWGWSDGLDKIRAAMERNTKVFQDADSAGAGFVQRLYEMSKAGLLVDDTGKQLARISKDASGAFNFDIDPKNIDAIAKKMNMTKEAVLSCLKALSMWGDVDFYGMDEVLKTLEEIGIAAETAGKKAVNVGRLTEQLMTLGKTDKEIYDIFSALNKLDGVVLLDVSSNVTTLTDELKALGVVSSDGITVSVNYEDLANLMVQLGYTKEETESVIKKFGELDHVSLKNAKGVVGTLQGAMDYISTLKFTSVEKDVKSISGAMDDVNGSKTDKTTAEIDNIGNAAETAATKVYKISDALDKVNGKECVVYYNVRRKNSILDTINSLPGFATGTSNAPAGAALVGEEGAELIQSGDVAYLAGTRHPEIVHLSEGDRVYTARETQKITHSSGMLSGVIPAYANGRATATGLHVRPGKTGAKAKSKAKTGSTSIESRLKETLQKLKDELDEIIGDFEHSIFLLGKTGGSTTDIVAIYRKMQEAVHAQAEKYRALGLSENSDYIQELQKQWWGYQDNIQDAIVADYKKMQGEHENAVKLTENFLKDAESKRDPANVEKYTGDIIAHYKKMQDVVHQQAEYYRSQGYSDTSDEVSQLSNLWWEYANNIKDVKQRVVDNLTDMVKAASDAMNDVQSAHETLQKIADDYATKGFIPLESYEGVINMGIQYMRMLKDENGMYTVNEEKINAVVAARAKQLTLESAMTYVERLRLAMQSDSVEELNDLLGVTSDATDATWGLVYANLAMIGLDNDQYQSALHNINALRSLAENAIGGIGQVAGASSDALNDMKSGLDDTLKYVMDMLKQRVNDQIDALENMKSAYKDIIDLRKQALESAKKESEYQDEVADKIKKIAKLQERINALSLDDSRDAQAQKAKLEEDMYGIQTELADKQSDYAVDAQSDALDDMADSYEKEKDKEINILKDSISSYQKLYDMAITYIKNHWDTLYSELITWNTQYGSDLNTTLTDAWNNALAAAQKYGDYVSALNSIGGDIDKSNGNGGSHNNKLPESHFDTSSSNDEMAHAIIKEMYANSQAYQAASPDRKSYLDQRNLNLGARLPQYGINAHRGNDGAWYVDGGELLYEKYKKYTYHKGGVVGNNPTPKQTEVLALLEKGEIVLNDEKEREFFRAVNMATRVTRRFKEYMNNGGYSILPTVTPFHTEAANKLAAINENRNSNIHFGDVNIYGANNDTVEKHREINRQFANEVLAHLNIKR